MYIIKLRDGRLLTARVIVYRKNVFYTNKLPGDFVKLKIQTQWIWGQT